jgi:putative flippase GtrA
MTTLVLTPRSLSLPSLPRVGRATVHQMLRYGLVGGLGTAVSALLYLVFRLWWDAVPANLAALVLSTLVSTEANRRFTFGGRPADRTREYLQNAGTVMFYAFYGSAVLVVLGDVVDEPTALQESAAVAVASVLGGLVRFLVLRNWVFAAHHTGVRQSGAVLRIRPIVRPARRALLAATALGGLLLSTAASCDTGSAAAPISTPTPAMTTAPAPVPSGGEAGDDHGGSGGSGGGRRGGERGGEDHGGDG